MFTNLQCRLNIGLDFIKSHGAIFKIDVFYLLTLEASCFNLTVNEVNLVSKDRTWLIPNSALYKNVYCIQKLEFTSCYLCSFRYNAC